MLLPTDFKPILLSNLWALKHLKMHTCKSGKSKFSRGSMPPKPPTNLHFRTSVFIQICVQPWFLCEELGTFLAGNPKGSDVYNYTPSQELLFLSTNNLYWLLYSLLFMTHETSGYVQEDNAVRASVVPKSIEDQEAKLWCFSGNSH